MAKRNKMYEYNSDDSFMKNKARDYLQRIGKEFGKLSKTNPMGNNLKAVYIIYMVFQINNSGGPTHQSISMKIYGTKQLEAEGILKGITARAYKNEYDHGDQRIVSYYLSNEMMINLNKMHSNKDFWCRLEKKERSKYRGEFFYEFVVLEFNKIGIRRAVKFNKTIHPFYNNMREIWMFNEGAISFENINLDETFRRASMCDPFLYRYEADFNTLSVLKYENAENYGKIIHVSDWICEDDANLKISIKLDEPIKVEEQSYKKIRKLLEITQEEYSLLMDDYGNIFAIGKIEASSSIKYDEVRFTGLLAWDYYKNGVEYLRFVNMMPRLPELSKGISENNIRLLEQTFVNSDISVLLRIIKEAVRQEHGTMIVFTENAGTEVNRLRKSAICIRSQDDIRNIVYSATKIDGAMLFDVDGTCYAIGVILDGEASDKADISRGARYNSAIRYIERQKHEHINAFAVVVSEDGYVDCFSTEQE